MLWDVAPTKEMTHGRILADYADWINAGMWERTGGPPSEDYAFWIDTTAIRGEFESSESPRSTVASGLLDFESVDRMYSALANHGATATETTWELTLLEILTKLTKHPDWKERLFYRAVRAARSRTDRRKYRECRAWTTGLPMSSRLIAKADEALGMKPPLVYSKLAAMAMGQTEDVREALLTTLVRLTDEWQQWSVAPVTQANSSTSVRPGSEIADADRIPGEIITDKADEIVSTNADEVFEQNWEMVKDVSNARERYRAQIAKHRERSTRSTAEIAEGGMAPDAAKRIRDAEIELGQLQTDMKTLDSLMNASWKAIASGEYKWLKSLLGANQENPLGKGDKLAAFERALSRLTPGQAHNIRFMVETALASSVLIKKKGGFDNWLKYFGRHHQANLKVAKTIEDLMRNMVTEAAQVPAQWDLLITEDDPLRRLMVNLFADFAAFVESFPGKTPEGFIEMATQTAKAFGTGPVSTIPEISPRVGVNKPITSETYHELLGRIAGWLFQATQNITVRQMINNGIGGFSAGKTLRQLNDAIEAFTVSKKDFVALDPLKPAEDFGLGAIYSGVFLEPAVGHELKRAVLRMQAAADVRNSMEIMSGAYRIESLWKRLATVARPTFHMRNLISGMWNNWLIGVMPWHVAKAAPDVIRYIKNKRKTAHLLGGTQLADDVIDDLLLDGIKGNKAMWRAIIKAEILDGSFSSTLGKNPTRIASKFNRANPFSPEDFVAYSWGGNAMEFIEGVLRVSAFEKYWDESMPFNSAMLAQTMVNLVHFDYSDLSPFDQKMVRFVPFWVWTSRNLPLQMRMLLENPRHLVLYESARENWNDQFSYDSDEYGNVKPIEEIHHLTADSRWILPFRREDEEGNWNQMTWQPGLPFEDLLDTPIFDGLWQAQIGDAKLPVSSTFASPSHWIAWAASSLAPMFSVVHDMAQDPRREFKVENAPAGLNGLLRIAGANSTPEGDVRVPPWVEEALTTAFPVYGEYTDLLGVRPNNPYAAGNRGLLPEEYKGDPGIDTMLWTISSRLGRGLGFMWQSQEDAFWQYNELQKYVAAQRLNTRFMIEPAQMAE